MKKKLLALLLASSMALMNVAPAYGTDIFTDPDNAANEDVISVPEELDNNGEFNDTEDEFTSSIVRFVWFRAIPLSGVVTTGISYRYVRELS